jgi:transcription antitermination protein NusB
MISRRILRIKVMQALYAYYKSAETASINDIEKELLFSVNKAYDLYHYLLLLLVDVANLAEKRLELAQNKKLPSHEDLNPNRKFIDNRIIQGLRVNKQLLHFLEIKKLSWVNNTEFIKSLFEEISHSELYNTYMSTPESSFSNDKSFVTALYSKIIACYEPLYNVLEEQSIYWNDEVEFILSAIIKTIKKFKDVKLEDAELMPLFKNDEDKEFSKTLFRKVVLNKDAHQELIQKFSKNWDLERIAFMDILLIKMAIAEVMDFESIPVRVTFNEYIELSKYYSTNRSNVFINGLLDKIINQLRNENKINKSGRGLIGDV